MCSSGFRCGSPRFNRTARPGRIGAVLPVPFTSFQSDGNRRVESLGCRSPTPVIGVLLTKYGTVSTRTTITNSHVTNS